MFNATEAVDNIIDDINTDYYKSCYDAIYEELCERVESGELTLKEAELINDVAYGKYIVEGKISDTLKKLTNLKKMSKNKKKQGFQRVNQFKLIKNNLYETDLTIDGKKVCIDNKNDSLSNPDFIYNINVTFSELSKNYIDNCRSIIQNLYNQCNINEEVHRKDIKLNSIIVSTYFDSDNHGKIDYALDINLSGNKIKDLKKLVIHWCVDTYTKEVSLRSNLEYKN